MSPARRSYALTVLVLVAAGGLTFWSLTRTWGSVLLEAPGLGQDRISVSGAESMPGVSAIGLVLLASALAVLAGSTRVRRVLGVLVVLVALACLGWVAFGSSAAVDSALDAAVAESASFTGTNAPETVDGTGWPLVTGAALLAAAAAGASIVWWAPRWPRMSSRYEAPGARAADEETDMWKAFDEGRDPTE